MRHLSPDQLLEYEIRKKPFLAEIESRLDDMDIEEIKSLQFPLPWIRAAFIARKQRRLQAPKIEDLLAQVIDGSNCDPEGQLVLWVGAETFLKTDRWLLSIMPNRFLFLPDSGGYFNGHVFSKTIDPLIHSGGRVVGRTTLDGYRITNQDARDRDCPADAQVIDLSGQNSGGVTAAGRLAGLGVRFS